MSVTGPTTATNKQHSTQSGSAIAGYKNSTKAAFSKSDVSKMSALIARSDKGGRMSPLREKTQKHPTWGIREETRHH
jgi:hypothetical protein